MRYTEDDVTNQLVNWLKNEADLDDLAAMYSEFRTDEIVVVVRSPNGPLSLPHINGKVHREEGMG
jgi:hypothetical protein